MAKLAFSALYCLERLDTSAHVITKQGQENHEAADRKKCCVCLLRYLRKAGPVTRQDMSPASLCQVEPVLVHWAGQGLFANSLRVSIINNHVNTISYCLFNIVCERRLANTVVNPGAPHFSDENTKAQLKWLLPGDPEVARQSHTCGVQSQGLCSFGLCPML